MSSFPDWEQFRRMPFDERAAALNTAAENARETLSPAALAYADEWAARAEADYMAARKGGTDAA